MSGLAGRIAIVTGAGSGIGRATALGLAEAGARVAAFDRDSAALESLMHEATPYAGLLDPVVCDVADWDRTQQAASRVCASEGRIDFVVNSAGTVRFLLSSEGAYLTGQSNNMTGGLWMN